MIKLTVLALFVALSSAHEGSSRLLLQGAAPGTNPAGVQPGTGNPDPAANPGGVTNPGPANPDPVANPGTGPVTPDPAVNPGTPAVNPGTPAVNPGTPAVNPGLPPQLPPILPPLPGTLGMFMPMREATCAMPYNAMTAGTAGSCAGRRAGTPGGPIEYNTIADNFKLYCNGGYGACYGSEFNVNVGGNAALPMGVRKIEQLLFSEPFSGYYATVNVKNFQNNGAQINVDRLEFADTGSGTGFTLNVWGASVNDVDCPRPENCANCNINFYMETPMCMQPGPPNPLCLIETKPCWGY